MNNEKLCRQTTSLNEDVDLCACENPYHPPVSPELNQINEENRLSYRVSISFRGGVIGLIVGSVMMVSCLTLKNLTNNYKLGVGLFLLTICVFLSSLVLLAIFVFVERRK